MRRDEAVRYAREVLGKQSSFNRYMHAGLPGAIARLFEDDDQELNLTKDQLGSLLAINYLRRRGWPAETCDKLGELVAEGKALLLSDGSIEWTQPDPEQELIAGGWVKGDDGEYRHPGV